MCKGSVYIILEEFVVGDQTHDWGLTLSMCYSHIIYVLVCSFSWMLITHMPKYMLSYTICL